MPLRRVVLVVLIVIAAIEVESLTSVAGAAAQILGYRGLLTWRREPVSKTAAMIAHMQADVYSSPRSVAPLLLVHGVNDTGKNSPDVRPIAEGFAVAGFRVVVPQFERLTRQNVTPEDVDDVVLAFGSLGADAGILCASYGCGPALIAASRPEIRDHVRFVAPFGGYFNLTDQLQYIITQQGDTPLAYSKWRYMGANADLLDTEDERRDLLAVSEERGTGPAEKWKLAASDLKGGARAMASLFESRDGAEYAERLLSVPRLRDRIQRLSPSVYLEGIRARLIIVHIASDPSIPSHESMELADAAAAHRIPHSLTLLNMYGHTRPVWPPFAMGNLFSFYVPESVKFGRVIQEILQFAR